MAAKKKTTKTAKPVKGSIDDRQTRLIAVQGVFLAVIGGIVLFGIIRMAQLRDEVDAMLMRELATPVQQVTPEPTEP